MRNILRSVSLLGTILIVAAIFGASMLLASKSNLNATATAFDNITNDTFSRTALMGTRSSMLNQMADLLTALNAGPEGKDLANISLKSINETAKTYQLTITKQDKNFAVLGSIQSETLKLIDQIASGANLRDMARRQGHYDTLRLQVLTLK